MQRAFFSPSGRAPPTRPDPTRPGETGFSTPFGAKPRLATLGGRLSPPAFRFARVGRGSSFPEQDRLLLLLLLLLLS